MDPLDQAITDIIITPLSEFQHKTSILDTAHNSAVQQFSKTVGALFTPPAQFSGPAADAVSSLLSDYLQTETHLTGHGPSPLLTEANDNCQFVIKRLQYSIDTHTLWPSMSSHGTQAAMIGGGILDSTIDWAALETLLAEIAAGTLGLAAGGAIVLAGMAAMIEQRKMEELQDVVSVLIALTLAIPRISADAALPHTPSTVDYFAKTPKPIGQVPSDAELPHDPTLTPGQKADANELEREFGNTIDVSLIEYILGIIGKNVPRKIAQAMVRCLYLNGFLDAYITTDSGRSISTWGPFGHLQPSDLEGAWKDLRDVNSHADHLQEVDNALNGLKNRITYLNRMISEATMQGNADKVRIYTILRDAFQKTINTVYNLIDRPFSP